MARSADAGYDVFLSHRSEDKPMVERLAEKLVEEAQLEPFLDRWHLIPGEPWQEGLEQALNRSRCCAVFVGPSGVGSWENEELRTALSRRVQENSFRVIPVLLPGADRVARDRLPSFLLRFTWVDFSAGIDDQVAFSRLVAGIRGQAPGRSAVQRLSQGSLYVRKSVREIMAEALRGAGIDLSGVPVVLGATIRMLVRRCQIQYPACDPAELARQIGKARATAYEEKYARRSRKEDERYRAFDEWESELHALLRHVGIGVIERCRAVNVGIGNGLESPFFYKDFQQLVGVDLSSRALTAAARSIPGLVTCCAEAETLDGVDSGAFDLYLSLRTYQSTLFDIGDALFEVCRVLKVGGRAVISIPYVYVDQGQALNGLLRPGGHDLDPDLPYEIADQVRRGLQNLGFEQLGIRTGLFEIYVYGQKTI
ncbi:MAG: TIR domain-containing protein [Candidatus Accumulibacter sp.]|uniref:TIR domain-containing protein n=1 Tax=Accumulibacter sp. TaxID=2053492 RepID=UPI001D3A21A8|nr:TIR domain-containing protein [Accumulibacter sp.]MCB1942977.1 TIR domain-containing protein [Accumulibacter sp.]